MAARRTIDIVERRARLAERHRLVPSRRVDDVVAIADDLVAVHSSDPVTVYLSIAARMAEPSLGAVDDAIYGSRTLVRHHAMRRTLWVMSHEVAGVAHAASTTRLLGPELRRFVSVLEAQGVADDGMAWFGSARAATLAALEELGPTTARTLGDAVPALRIPIELGSGTRNPAVQAAHTRVLLLLGFEGAVIRCHPTGTWINGQYRWATTRSWVAPRPVPFDGADPDIAATQLVDRWLRAFGPGTTADLAWWTGWPLGLTRAAIARAGAVEVDLSGAPGWVAADDVDRPRSGEPWVALLPGLDAATMGWKERHWYLPAEHAPRLFDRNGNGGPTVWVDGRIVGGWVQRRDGTIAYRLLDDVGAERRDAIDAAAHLLERLVGDVRFTVRFPAPLQAELLR